MLASGSVPVAFVLGTCVYHIAHHATEFFATGTAIRRLDPSHHLPGSAPKPTFTLSLDG